MRIAFFDSGLGGLTVLSEAMKELPQEDFLFYADTLHVPYGTKAKEDVKSYIHHAMETIMKEEVKAIVVACNTATSMAISDLRKAYPIPVIGMEPAVKPAVEINRSSGKRILVLATPLTIKESKYRDLVRRVDSMHIVDSLPLPELVEHCEALNFDRKVMKDYFTKQFESFDMNEYGTIVLGCTHYPFYKSILSDLLPDHIRMIDGSKGTVNRLIQVLSDNDLLSSSGNRDVTLFNSRQSMEYTEKMKKALSLYGEIEG
ncbi:glutamate racemase [Paenibacillus sp. FSL W7-1279]|uniref:glutamate racemase n=1 Tax=Paenibacillus sp. FSL W7-1279 TaxID=2921697 RepID=UPI0030DB1855